MVPPFVPDHEDIPMKAVYPDFEAAMREYGKTKWLTDMPSEEDDRYFSSWYVD